MSLFQIYDGVGPVKRPAITQHILAPQQRVQYQIALARNGLYDAYWADASTDQTRALRFAPVVVWSLPEFSHGG